MFESIPDGISIVSSKPHSRHDGDHKGDKRNGDTNVNGDKDRGGKHKSRGSVEIYVNHETSTVPFPYSTSSPGGNLNDFTDSLVSALRINRNSDKITSAKYVIDDGDALPSPLLELPGDRRDGFDRSMLFTNEEGIDWVNRARHCSGRRRSGTTECPRDRRRRRAST